MMIVIRKEINRNILENVFVTALEGGSNYWYFIPTTSVEAIRNVVPKEEEPFLSIALLKAVIDHNIDVPINDIENEEDEIGVISASTMKDRIQKLAEEMPDVFLCEINEEGDADSSDTWFQYITLGELIFG